MNRSIVFAFGSNLDTKQMKRRCPSARPFASAVLRNFRLTFGGYSAKWKGGIASVEEARGSVVHGLLYRLRPSELALLDSFEGVPYQYERVWTRVRDITGKRHKVHLYQLAADMPPNTPSVEYLLTILRAYDRLGFPRRDLLEAAMEAP